MHAYLYFACSALDGTRWPAALSPIDWPNGDPLFLVNNLLIALLLVIVAGGLIEHVAQRKRKAGALTRTRSNQARPEPGLTAKTKPVAAPRAGGTTNCSDDIAA